MKKTILKMVLPAVLICLCLMPLMYSAVATTPTAKIFFTWAPGGCALFVHPTGFLSVHVWAAYMIGSTYGGPFTLVYLDYMYSVGQGAKFVHHYVDYWYTDNLAAGNAYAALSVAVYTDARDVYDSYTVTSATITTNQPSSNPDYLSVKVAPISGGSFTVEYWADTSHPIESQPVTAAVPSNLFLGTRDFRPLANVVVTGIDSVGLSVGTWYSNLPSGPDYGLSFRYVQAELYDPSLLLP
jgi:hypothetical protein